MNLYLTKISRSYVKGVLRYQGGRTDHVFDVDTKTLGIQRVKSKSKFLFSCGMIFSVRLSSFSGPRLLKKLGYDSFYVSEFSHLHVLSIDGRVFHSRHLDQTL